MRIEHEKPFVKVWRFHDAPEYLRNLSTHGGDEDWLALIPPAMALKYVPWAETGTAFGVCEVSEHKLEDGSIVRIGAHA
jgi:hypothetical protein